MKIGALYALKNMLIHHILMSSMARKENDHAVINNISAITFLYRRRYMGTISRGLCWMVTIWHYSGDLSRAVFYRVSSPVMEFAPSVITYLSSLRKMAFYYP